MDLTEKTIFILSKIAACPPECREVNAILVGGTDGVFAAWREGNLVYLAAGDDGTWREIASYHENWIPDILYALASLTDLVHDCDAMEEVEALRLELERKDILIAMLRGRVMDLATELDSRPHRETWMNVYEELCDIKKAIAAHRKARLPHMTNADDRALWSLIEPTEAV